MTINLIKGNLIKDIIDGKISGHVLHGCNAQGVMGRGIAKQIKDNFTSVNEAYMSAFQNKGLSLGMTIPVRVNDITIFWNLITQRNYGRENIRYVSYDAIDDAMINMRRKIEQRPTRQITDHLYFPLIGCGLANGKWAIVSSIIEAHFPDFDKTLYEYTP